MVKPRNSAAASAVFIAQNRAGSVICAPWIDPPLPCLPSRRWGGRRIHDLDDGGLWSSDEAGETQIARGPRRAGSGSCPLARRAPSGRTATGDRPARPPHGRSARATGRRVVKAREEPANDGRTDNGHAGRQSRRNGNPLSQTGRGPAPRALPTLAGGRRRDDPPCAGTDAAAHVLLHPRPRLAASGALSGATDRGRSESAAAPSGRPVLQDLQSSRSGFIAESEMALGPDRVRRD